MSMMQYKHHRRARVSYLAGATAVSAVITVVALRHNYQTMTKLRSAVFTADEKDGDVETALQNLRAYVGSHMNTDLNSGDNTIYPPIQLQYRYERLVAAQKAKQASGNIYAAAQANCTAQGRQNDVGCIDEYLASQGSSNTQTTVPDAMYKFDFVSPTWSPDVAGFGIVITIVLAIATVGLLIKRRFLKRH